MKRMLKRMATVLFLAVCVGLIPANAAGRPRHPSFRMPDVFDIAWTQIVTQAQQVFPVLRIVHIALIQPDLEQRSRQVQERQREPGLVVPRSDRELYRSRTR